MQQHVTIKGQSLTEWEKWLKTELTPPLANFCKTPEGKHVMEAFYELIKRVNAGGVPVSPIEQDFQPEFSGWTKDGWR